MKIFKRTIPGTFVFGIMLFFSFQLPAQNLNGNKIFNNNFVHEIRISLTQANFWDTLLTYYRASHDSTYSKSKSLVASVIFDGEKIDSVGVRLKGVFSFTIPSDKKPIRLDFNEYVKNNRYDGIANLGLSNEYPDISLLRNSVAYEVFRQIGVKAPRTSFARVYINDVYRGLYVIIEQVDKTYLKSSFGRDDGDLIKPRSGKLYWNEEDSLAFINSYEVKSTDKEQAYNRLFDLVKKIGVTPSELFYDSLKSVFDFNSYISVFAADVVFNNMDSYFGAHNYYLYWDKPKNMYYYLPWDYNVSLKYGSLKNKSFSILPGGENQSVFFLPLPSKVINNGKLKLLYLDKINIINNKMISKELISWIKKTHKMISPHVLKDTNKVFSNDQFRQSLTSTAYFNDTEIEGLLSFLNSRHDQISWLLDYVGYKRKSTGKN